MDTRYDSDHMIAARLQMPAVLAFAFTAIALNVKAISINIIRPVAGAPVTETLAVEASVSSDFELASVTAAVAGRQTDLIFSSGANVWTNTILIAGIPSGPTTLTVMAQDLFGNTAQTQRVFAVDYPPTLTVVAPLNGTVARPQVYVEATAGDDSPTGKTVINVYNGGVALLRGTNSVKGIVSIWAANYPVLFEAVDSAGQARYIPRQVFLETNNNLIEVAVAPGPLLDVTADRFLYSVSADVLNTNSSMQYGKAEARIFHERLRKLTFGRQSLPTMLPLDSWHLSVP